MREYLKQLFLSLSKELTYLKEIEITFEIPKDETHGDLSTNAALLLSKILKKNPRQTAEEIKNNIKINTDIIEKN